MLILLEQQCVTNCDTLPAKEVDVSTELRSHNCQTIAKCNNHLICFALFACFLLCLIRHSETDGDDAKDTGSV